MKFTLAGMFCLVTSAALFCLWCRLFIDLDPFLLGLQWATESTRPHSFSYTIGCMLRVIGCILLGFITLVMAAVFISEILGLGFPDTDETPKGCDP